MILCSVAPGPGALTMPRVCRGLAETGHLVEVILERGTKNFVGAAAFAGHAAVVRKPTKSPRALVFAPANAGTLARLAHGMGETPVEEVYAAGIRPAIIVPSPEEGLLEHPAVRKNLEQLREDGCRIVEAGEENLNPVDETVTAVLGGLGGPLSGMRILVTTGGTREPIDSVRFVGNRSSGKMGRSVAREAIKMGAEVTVIAANVEAREPGVEWVPVETVDELREATVELAAESTALVMAAAVSDFKPATAPTEKVRRREGLNVEFVATEDILGSLRERNPDLFMVGFAATHGDPVPDARDKLASKGVNLVVGNDISKEGIGFGADENEVYVVGPEGERFVPQASKSEIARAILDELETEIKKERQR